MDADGKDRCLGGRLKYPPGNTERGFCDILLFGQVSSYMVSIYARRCPLVTHATVAHGISRGGGPMGKDVG
jgi:hypothetical protein